MTSEDRYYMYKFAIETDPTTRVISLVLTRPIDQNSPKSDKTKEPISYDLKNIQACTIDTEFEKNACSANLHFAMNLVQKKSRKVYFTSHW